jgi:hypothetical protein
VAGEIRAEIVFADNETIKVRSTFEQIKNAIDGVTLPHDPLIKVIDEDGQEVGSTPIRLIKRYEEPSP